MVSLKPFCTDKDTVSSILGILFPQLRKCPTIETIPEVEAKAAAANAAAAAAAASAGASGDSGALPLSSANKRQKPNAAKAARERAKHAPLGSDFPLEQLVNYWGCTIVRSGFSGTWRTEGRGRGGTGVADMLPSSLVAVGNQRKHLHE